jgi:dolichyl-phosphate-mannose--protein O-mannosyl transferase
LHSHASLAPITGKDGQHEITCFGENGKGDMNDNWRVETESRKALETNAPFRLVHTMRGYRLHSHGGAVDPQFTFGHQEVTGYPGTDENDLWTVERTYGPVLALRIPVIAAAAKWLSALHIAASLASSEERSQRRKGLPDM